MRVKGRIRRGVELWQLAGVNEQDAYWKFDARIDMLKSGLVRSLVLVAKWIEEHCLEKACRNKQGIISDLRIAFREAVE